MKGVDIKVGEDYLFARGTAPNFFNRTRVRVIETGIAISPHYPWDPPSKKDSVRVYLLNDDGEPRLNSDGDPKVQIVKNALIRHTWEEERVYIAERDARLKVRRDEKEAKTAVMARLQDMLTGRGFEAKVIMYERAGWEVRTTLNEKDLLLLEELSEAYDDLAKGLPFEETP